MNTHSVADNSANRPANTPTNDDGLERTLRLALHTELNLRLRHALLHGLKGPVQTILSALHLMQKKALAGQTQDLEKYANWIKDAAKDLTDRAQEVLPPKPLPPGQTAAFDWRALTESVAHTLRDEAALKNIELAIAPAAAPALTQADEGDVRLALLALLLRVIEAAPENSAVRVGLEQTNDSWRWSAEVAGPNKPGPEAFEVRHDILPPQSGLAWHVARNVVLEGGGKFTILDEPGGWCVELFLPRS